MKTKVRTMASPLIVAPVKGAHSRQMPGVLIIDSSRRIRMANDASIKMLRPMLGSEVSFSSDADLPAALQGLINDVESRLAVRPDACSVMLPSFDVCVRACMLAGDHDHHLLLIIERASRQDVVRSALASFPLTPREAEVAALVLRGYSNRRIADSLVLAEYTVEDHLKRIFAKVGVNSRSALSSKVLGIREEATG